MGYKGNMSKAEWKRKMFGQRRRLPSSTTSPPQIEIPTGPAKVITFNGALSDSEAYEADPYKGNMSKEEWKRRMFHGQHRRLAGTDFSFAFNKLLQELEN